MAGSIIDGTGANYRAQVKSNNHLQTDAITESTYELAVEENRAFNINTFDGTLAAQTGEQAILYIKNNSSEILQLKNMFGGFWNVTAGTNGINKVKVYQNPTGGTLLSDANEIEVKNRAAGAIDTFASDITVYEATAGGKTITGNDDIPNAFIIQGSGRLFVGIDLSIPPAQSIAVTVDTAGGSADYYMGFAGYVHAKG